MAINTDELHNNTLLPYNQQMLITKFGKYKIIMYIYILKQTNMIQIKLFTGNVMTKLENEVNDWLKESQKEIISINMSNDVIFYTILITYKN